ncbi:ExbD/TolR family protein [Ruegeria lacuscaerulensis]|uniref:ExbD/TolR family protein n=1 Tax=Ruegeria lacuscaerulensis TaxID=55218 RepID=UPI00147F2980|nr:biopolymer transporter ExbD [Ruegeria lacuscaerulensis]
MIRSGTPRRKRDSTIPLINVVFLMLIFFLITGTIATPLDPYLELVNTSELEGREPPDALVLHKDGTLSFRGNAILPELYMEGREPGAVRIVPDREAPGARLIEITGQLRRLGASSVFVVTEKALQ